MAKDLVCGMQVNETAAAGKSEYQGKTYYFCSAGCKAAFEKEPERFIQSKEKNSGHHHHH
jgi:YHS domain-containing protein